MDVDTSFPGEKQQIENFGKNARDIFNIDTDNKFLKLALSGLSTIVPKEVNNSKILENEKLLNVGENLLSFQITLNDRIDFEYSNREDLVEFNEYFWEKEEKAIKRLDSSLQLLDDKAEAFIIRDRINTLVKETEFVEKYIREKGDNITLDDAIEYRRLVNAIAISTLTGILLGQKHLSDMYKTEYQGELSWDKIKEKYQWIFDGNAKNKVQRAVVIMDRIVTVTQIDDDWYGKDIDRLLSIPTIALAAIRQNNGNEAKAKKELNSLRSDYMTEARKQGLAVIPTFGATTITFLYQWAFNSVNQLTRRRFKNSKRPLTRK